MIVLASGSPRRRALLSELGVPFTVEVPDIDETPRDGEDARSLVARLSEAKAVAVAARRPKESVLAADTTVVKDGAILGKPEGREDATRMLGLLQGGLHEVYTGCSLVTDSVVKGIVVRTLVTMIPMSPEEVAWYVGTGEPMDKAGSYAIQGIGAALVSSIEGSYTNVVGLPLAEVVTLLRSVGAWQMGERGVTQ